MMKTKMAVRMRRSVVFVAVILTVLPATLSAQRAGARAGVTVTHAPAAVSVARAPAASFTAHTPAAVPAFRGSGVQAHPGVHIGVEPYRRFTRPIVVAPLYYGAYYAPYYSPYYSSYWPSTYAATVSPMETYSEPLYPEPAYTAPAEPAADASSDLAYQVGQLSAEVAALRAERAAQPAQPQAQTGSTSHAVFQTVLVYKDGHRQEIQNYAVVGQTLWIFDEHSSTKISLADLDLTATQNENRLHGMRFTVPEK